MVSHSIEPRVGWHHILQSHVQDGITLASACLSRRLSARNNCKTTGRIFIKFDIGQF
jgi:hypothetical protein